MTIWERENTVLYLLDNQHKNLDFKTHTIAAFDIDSTIVKTKLGQSFAKNEDDWVFLNQTVKNKLIKLNSQNCIIVFFTNQWVTSVKQDLFIKKTEQILQCLNIPISVFCSLAKDNNRKPAIGMWNMFLHKTQIVPNICESFFVGDAAGRDHFVQNNQIIRHEDFSDCDKLFANCIGLDFHTTESFFDVIDQTLVFELAPSPLKHQRLIICVGCPCSGKTTFINNFVLTNPEYTSINQDTLKTFEKCLKLAKHHLQNGQNVIIDNTNPSQNTRKKYLDLDIECEKICLFFNLKIQLAEARNQLRLKPVPKIAYTMFVKNFEEPKIEEGFKNVFKIYSD